MTDERGALLESYTYDHQARRLADIRPESQVGERRFSYGHGDRLAAAGNAQYSHDRAGFRNLKVVGAPGLGGAETWYHYEPSGLLLAVDLPSTSAGGSRIEYAYDANGLRREKRLDGRLVAAYDWLDPLRLSEFFDGREWWRLAYLDDSRGGRTPVGVTNGRDSFLLLTDQLGTPVALATPDGRIVQRMRYDSFGNLLESRGGVVDLPLGFAGGLFDQDTGLTRFVWRDYDAETGRFTALDPLREKGGDADFYGYCVDDPVNRVDVWGLRTLKGGFAISGSLPGIGGTAGIGYGTDDKSSRRVQASWGYGPATGVSASAGVYGEYTNATKMDDLAGKGKQAGWSFGDLPVGEFKVGRSYGADKVMGEGYEGVSVQGGFGIGAPEAHVYDTTTWSQEIPWPDFRRDTPSDDFDLYNRD